MAMSSELTETMRKALLKIDCYELRRNLAGYGSAAIREFRRAVIARNIGMHQMRIDERESDRAACEAGYMDIRDYVAKYQNVPPDSVPPRNIDQPSRRHAWRVMARYVAAAAVALTVLWIVLSAARATERRHRDVQCTVTVRNQICDVQLLAQLGQPSDGVPGRCIVIDPRAPLQAMQFNSVRGLSYLRHVYGHDGAWYARRADVTEDICRGDNT